MSDAFREAVIDLDAVSANVRRLRQLVGTPHAMAVVKANAYGHGAVECARAALAGGADWLGVAEIAEALGYETRGAMVHRDDLVVSAGAKLARKEKAES